MCAACEEPILVRLEKRAEEIEKKTLEIINDFNKEVDRLNELIEGPALTPATKEVTDKAKESSRFLALESRLSRITLLNEDVNNILARLRRNINQIRGGDATK